MDTTEDIVNRLNMIFEEKRRESYSHWPFTEKDACSIQNMSEAGFFWTGTKEEPDSAQCFVCNKPLDGWDSTDDPWMEHKKHSPECPFVVIGKKEDDLRFDQFIDIWKIMARNLANSEVDKHQQILMEKIQETRKQILKYKNKTKNSK